MGTVVESAPAAEDGDSGPSAISSLPPLSGFRRDVQALRGLAVLLVVLYHARVVVPGGFIGVDVFFVISGFVIGRLLVAEFASTGRMSFKAFYLRRARRLLPALAAMLTLVLVLAPFMAPMGADDVTSRTGIAAALFSANAYLYTATDVGYFDAAAELNPLLHTWSLSVEEQFYFVVPTLLLIAWKLGRRWRGSLSGLRWFVALASLVSFAGCIWLSFTESVGPIDGLRFAFFSPVTRTWEFAAGIAVVLLPAAWHHSRMLRGSCVAIGLALIAFAAFTFDHTTRFPGYAAVVPVLGSVLVLFGGTSPTPRAVRASRLLRPMERLGDLSYSWYLWHWPAIVFAAAFWPNSGRLPLVVAAAVALAPAWISYHLLEQRLRATATTRGLPTLGLAACCIALPLASVVPSRALTEEPANNVELATRDAMHLGRARACNVGPNLNALRGTDCEIGTPDGEPDVVLIGDSNADHISETVAGAVTPQGGRLTIATLTSCPFVDVEMIQANRDPRPCRDFVTQSLEQLLENPPDLVVMAASTESYLLRRIFSLGDPTTGVVADTRQRKETVYREGLRRTVRTLTDAGIRVAVVESLPKPEAAGSQFDHTQCSRALLRLRPTRCGFPAFRLDETYTVTANEIERTAAAGGGGETWDFSADICPNGRCDEASSSWAIWRDRNHITVRQAEELVPTATDYLDRGPLG